MFCKYCGKELSQDAEICPHCGRILNAKPYTPPVAEPNVLAILGLIFAFLMPVAGLVLSILGKSRARELNGNGETIAKAGIIISVIYLAIAVIAVIAIYALAVAGFLAYAPTA